MTRVATIGVIAVAGILALAVIMSQAPGESPSTAPGQEVVGLPLADETAVETVDTAEVSASVTTAEADPEEKGTVPASFGASEDGVFHLTFGDIASFEYPFPKADDPRTSEEREKQIPDAIKALDGQRVTIEGYMMPLDFDGENLTGFYLARKMFSCCFGDYPKAPEIVESDVVDGGSVTYYEHIPVHVTGTLTVGENLDHGNLLNSIFQLQVESVANPEGKQSDHQGPPPK